MKKYLLTLLVLLSLAACVTKDRPAEQTFADLDSIAEHTKDSIAKAAAEEKQKVEEAKKKVAEKPKQKPRQEEAKPVEKKEPEKPKVAATGELNGHTWVDMGLSVKWATCNVGANSPEECGDYYAWGERNEKETYTRDNSQTDDSNTNNIINHRRRDVARNDWGEGWRLPSKTEVQELAENCETTWVTRGGMNGKLVTSKITGGSIFLPAAGYRGSELYELGESGRYWTGTSEGGKPDAEFLFFYSEHFNWHRDHRYYGLTVRPVTEQ